MKILKYFIVASIIFLTFGCKQDNYMVYDGEAYIHFGPERGQSTNAASNLNDTMKMHTFFYDEATVTKDVKLFDIYVIGGPKDYDRHVTLRQVKIEKEGVINAIPGVHYLGFDSPEVAEYYVLKKDSVHLYVPIVMLRDPSLKTQSITLEFEVLANKEFKLGDPKLLWRRLEFTDALSRPQAWNASAVSYYWGDYSLEKHKWMIKVSNIDQNGVEIKPNDPRYIKWDQEWMAALPSDYALQTYWMNVLAKKLLKENLEREANGEGPLTDENGNEIKFPAIS